MMYLVRAWELDQDPTVIEIKKNAAIWPLTE